MKRFRAAAARTTPSPVVVLVGMATLVVVDVIFLVRAVRSTTALRPAAEVGLAASAVWVLVFGAWRTLQARKRRGPVRTVLGWTAAVSLLGWAVSLGLAFPTYRQPHADNVVAAATMAFGVGFGTAMVLFIAVSAYRARGDQGDPTR